MFSSSIFVVADNMAAGVAHQDGHLYWKMQITSIHANVTDEWVVGNWFYSPSELDTVRGLSNEYVPALFSQLQHTFL